MQVPLFLYYIYIVVVINFLKLLKSDILTKKNIPPIITPQYMYLCPNYKQINLVVTSNSHRLNQIDQGRKKIGLGRNKLTEVENKLT